MKGPLLIVVVYISVHQGLCRTLSITSDHCQPCGSPSMDVRRTHNRSPGDICTIANEFTIKIDNLRRTVRDQLETLVSDVFDGDDSYLEWRYQQRRRFLMCAPSSGTSRLSAMASLYDRLVGLHVYVDFTEGYSPSCSVTVEGIAHHVSLAMCDLHHMMRVTSQTQGHEEVCRKECGLTIGGCVLFQRHAFKALRYASDVLESIFQEAELLKQRWGC